MVKKTVSNVCTNGNNWEPYSTAKAAKS